MVTLSSTDEQRTLEVMTELARICFVTEERCLTAAEADTMRQALELARRSRLGSE